MKPSVLSVSGLLFAPSIALAAFSVGGPAYTKLMDTKLLATPSSTAQSLAKLPYRTKLQVKEIKGHWLLVREHANEGWVFFGNLTEKEPSETADIDLLPSSASATSATAAARPLAAGASDYADRQGMAAARSDVQWVEKDAAKIGPEEVLKYLRDARKGEFL